MSPARVLLLATLDTKAEEADYLIKRLAEHEVTTSTIDLSLSAAGTVLDGPEKLKAMERAVVQAQAQVSDALVGAQAVIGIGGGTGGEIALRVMRSMPITFPKVLVTTLPFDPRFAAADTSIVLVPTLADICGLNATIREVLENAAALTAGLCTTRRDAGLLTENRSVGITALGVTEAAVQALVAALRARGEESTVFHSNGFGGAAFARFAKRGAFRAIVDLTPHELTRLVIAGVHVPMPERFTAAGELPRVVLPGALNFIGLGEREHLAEAYLNRPHYAHSSFFTHVKMTADEMLKVTDALADILNGLSGPVALVVPMGGFSHHDRPGGAIEDPELRGLFLDRARERLSGDIRVRDLDAHIAEPATTRVVLEELDALASRNAE
ncbi:MAG: Tm-1-like ATP-binding domain-containing protein [Paracoccaceae bacterium]|nr:Tm-1-like ATP-binding domain-containing protein [Paracoccaceae bacterium]